MQLMTLIRVRVVLLMGLRGEPAAGSKCTEGEQRGMRKNKQQICVTRCRFYIPPSKHLHAINIHANSDTYIHTYTHTQRIFLEAIQKGLSDYKMNLWIKISSLWDVKMRHRNKFYI